MGFSPLIYNEKDYINWRRKNDGISATYIGPSANHKTHYEAQEDGGKVQPLAMGVYRKPQKVNGRRHSINTWVIEDLKENEFEIVSFKDILSGVVNIVDKKVGE